MKVRKQGSSSEPPWLENIRAHYWVQDVLQIFVGLNCWIIQWDGKKNLDWMELTPQDPTLLRPHHFEYAYGKGTRRDAFHIQNFNRAIKEKKAIVDECWGTYSLFIHLGQVGNRQIFLYGDSFLVKPADWASLSNRWGDLTGKQPSNTDLDFIKYVRMNLSFPVLDVPLLRGVIEFFEDYVDLLSGTSDPAAIYERVNRLRKSLFSKMSNNRAWLQEALGQEKLIPPPWAWNHGYHLEPWMVEELGINKIPNFVFAVMPLRSTKETDLTAQNLVQNYQIQRACTMISRTFPQTLAENLQDYGVAFITAVDPALRKNSIRAHISEIAEEIQKFIKEKFGLESVVGVGRMATPGETLYRSYKEAILALNLGVQMDKRIYFYEDASKMNTVQSYQRIHEAELELVQMLDNNLRERIKLSGDHFVREVLEFSSNNFEAIRVQFLACLSHLFDRINKKTVLNTAEMAIYYDKICRRITHADSTSQLIFIFKETLQNLSQLTGKPMEGTKTFRIQELLFFLNNNFERTLTLPEVAKQSGFSVPVFCRHFKKTTGESFVTYLNKLRVEKAKSLLKTNDLPVYQVGSNCGFPTTYHFNRNFKRWTKMTPTDYRRKFTSLR